MLKSKSSGIDGGHFGSSPSPIGLSTTHCDLRFPGGMIQEVLESEPSRASRSRSPLGRQRRQPVELIRCTLGAVRSARLAFEYALELLATLGPPAPALHALIENAAGPLSARIDAEYAEWDRPHRSRSVPPSFRYAAPQ
jgi:hypothetical protein